jgi:hypothetical protein
MLLPIELQQFIFAIVKIRSYEVLLHNFFAKLQLCLEFPSMPFVLYQAHSPQFLKITLLFSVLLF